MIMKALIAKRVQEQTDLEDQTKNAKIAYEIVERHLESEFNLYIRQATRQTGSAAIQSEQIAKALDQIKSMLVDIKVNLD